MNCRHPRGRTSRPRPTGRDGGFTLIEVIVALGILGGGLVTVLAMFSPLARVDAASGELPSAIAAGAAVNARLRQWPLAEVEAALGTTLLVSRDGSTVGVAADPVWNSRGQPAFFAVELRRESQPEEPVPVPWLAFSLRVRWPVVGSSGQRETVMGGSVRR